MKKPQVPCYLGSRKPIAKVMNGGVNMLAAKLNIAVLLVGERSEHAQHAEDERGDEVQRPADCHEPLVRVHLVQSFKTLEGPL